MYRVVRKKIEVGTPAAATWPCSPSTSEQRKLREIERCHNASLRPRGVWASRPRRPATANVLRRFSRYRQRGRQSTRVWQVKVYGIYRERDCLELVRSVFLHVFHPNEKISKRFPSNIRSILPCFYAHESRSKIWGTIHFGIWKFSIERSIRCTTNLTWPARMSGLKV